LGKEGKKGLQGIKGKETGCPEEIEVVGVSIQHEKKNRNRRKKGGEITKKTTGLTKNNK